jgi:hypothetical protein
VIALSGEENRKIFLNDRNLDLAEGYRILSGGIPKISDIKHKEDSDVSDFIKRLVLLFRKERINEGAATVYVSISILILTFASVFPVLLEDADRRMKDWGSEGKMNPFKEVYEVSLYLLPHVYDDLTII